MNLLLDTHSFLWFIKGDARLSAHAVTSFQKASRVFLSAVSVWEIAQKYHVGKLPLPREAAAYVQEQRATHQIESLPFMEEDCLHFTKLPAIHRDPFDRMLICQAIEHGLTIVTNDRAIMAYPIKTLW
jgi:PIN domain nuclease of toxin-antitoxin system